MSLGRIGDVNVVPSKIEWKISNFLTLSVDGGFYYNSSTFRVSNKIFHLRLYPSGVEDSEFISLFVVNENQSPCYVTFTLSIKQTDGTFIKTITCTNINLDSDWGYKQFCKKSLLWENDLTVLCTLELIRDEKRDIAKEEHLQERKPLDLDQRQLKELYELSKNFKDFYANECGTDVIFKISNRELRAHRAILIARSSVFAALFLRDTLERKTGFVDIPDCDPDSFPKFLEYLYCGSLKDISFHSAFHLYSTSAKYDVRNLKKFCIDYLIENLTADNVCDIIVLADKHDEMKLQSGTKNFFIDNFRKIVLTAEWMNLLKNNYCLANKLLIELSKTTASKHE